jgi:hypothetical protein
MISSVIVISSKKFLGGAYDREKQSELLKIHGNLFLNHWIGKVAAIPGQKKINVMQCRNRNMKRIFNRLGGNDGLLKKAIRPSESCLALPRVRISPQVPQAFYMRPPDRQRHTLARPTEKQEVHNPSVAPTKP